MIGEDLLSDIDAELNHFNDLHPDVSDECITKYHTTESYSRDMPDNSHAYLKIIHLNARSLFHKFDNFFQL